MDISTVHTASFFLSGAILTCLGLIVIIAAVIFVNNIFVKYWKPIRLFTYVPVPETVHDPLPIEPAIKKSPN